MIDLILMGDVALQIRGTASGFVFPTQKALALFTYLALRAPVKVSRTDAAALLWADVPADQARHSLRQALFEIRRGLEAAPSLLIADRYVLTVDHRRVRTDVRRFERLVARRTPPALRLACGLYRGDLLVGLHTREARFDMWVAAERVRLKQLAIEAHEAFLRHLLAQGLGADAIRTAASLIDLDPFEERAHRALSQLYAQTDLRKAVHQLHKCVDLLSRVGRVPEVETRALLEDFTRRLSGSQIPASDPHHPGRTRGV